MYQGRHDTIILVIAACHLVMMHTYVSVKGEFRTLSNIYDRVFCENFALENFPKLFD